MRNGLKTAESAQKFLIKAHTVELTKWKWVKAIVIRAPTQRVCCERIIGAVTVVLYFYISVNTTSTLRPGAPSVKAPHRRQRGNIMLGSAGPAA